MSVKNFGFPLPVKIEEDQKLFIDLDTEENSPEDIVIEWHLEIRRFFGSYSAASGEIKLVSIMKEYITAITERAIHFEHVIRLHEMVDNHMEHIYWFYRDSDICFSDLYLDYMEHIMTFYVNLTLRVLLVLKNKIKVTQEMVNETTQKVIKRLSFYLLKSEYHIFHVLIRQTTTMVDGMIKDLMNILNSNICKQMFRNLYKYFLVMTPIRDMSDEAFCRAFILFENWKAFENYKHNEKIEKCMENIFNRSVDCIKESEFLKGILMPKTSIMSELMKVMGCDPSITKAYFDYVKSKQKSEGEIIDDIGKLALEDILLSDTESIDEDDGVDFEDKYIELFDNIMKDTEYNLEEIMLNCKNERSSSEVASEEQDPEILVLDTDSDSDVEIVSITPSTKQVPNTPRRSKNPTSFLESISVDVDTTRRKYGFRTLGNFNNSPSKNTMESAQSTTANVEQPPQTVPEQQEVLEVTTPIETLNIDDDDIVETTEINTEVPVKENSSVVNIMQADTSGTEMSKSDKVTSSDFEVSISSPSNLSSDLSEVPMELETSYSNEKIIDTAAPKVVEVSSSSNSIAESQSSAVQDIPSVSKTAQVPIGVQTNGTINHICRCSQLLGTLAITEKGERFSEIFPAITSTTSENVKVVTQSVRDDQDCTKRNEKASENTSDESVLKDIEVEERIIPDIVTEGNIKNSEVEATTTPEVLEESSKNDAVETTKDVPKDSSVEEEVEATIIREDVTEENSKNSDVETIITTEEGTINNGTEAIDELVETPKVDEVDDTQHKTDSNEVGTAITDKSTEREEVEAPIAVENPSKDNVGMVLEENFEEVEISNEEVLLEQVIETEYAEIASEEIVPLVPEVQKETDEQVEVPTIPLEVRMDTLTITDATKTVVDLPAKPLNGCVAPSEPTKEPKVNGALLDKDERTSQCDALVTVCRTEDECEDTAIPRMGESATPLDTGQEEDPSLVPPIDTGQFDVNSPASPEDAPKSGDTKMLRVVGGLRKGQQHGEFGYPTPPGSEEEREKDTDEQTKLIYSHILPTQTSNVAAQEDFMTGEIEADDQEIDNGDLLDEERALPRCATPGLGKSYEQIVKDSVGSQNSSEDDEDDDTPIVGKKCNSKDEDQDISFDEMEQFLKSCDNDDYPQTANRKKRKRQREKTVAEDSSRSRKNSFTRSPKRVKINDEPETHFIPYDEDSQDDVWSNQNVYDPSSSSDDEEDVGRRSLAKRRPSPMPLSKYLSKRNGVNTHIPLSGRLSPEKPPPLKGILKRIEQRHTYHPLHPVDDEPETVVIVLHQREIGRGKRGSVEVKVYRKSFSAFKVPFDDHKLCHHALVRLDRVKDDDLDVWGRVSVRTRDFEEEMYSQPEKPMYKIVFDKKSPQLNSNDRKYYCDPSITSPKQQQQQPNKSTLYESENEQGTVHSSTEISYPTPPLDPPVPISPPCFSPSSNSSSEFNDPAHLIPFQDIERALLVVEPDKSESREPTRNADKSIDMETIELLSNNADFHKMLRDLNGDVLIEKVPLIGVEETADGVVTAFVDDNDLVSNLNTDEQLLKKVCQELESEAMVDNLTAQNRVMVEQDRVGYDAQVSTYSTTIPGDSFPLHVVSNAVSTPLGRRSYSSVPDPPLAHSGYTEAGYPPTFTPAGSPSVVDQLYPSDLSGYSMRQQPYPNMRYPSEAKPSSLTANSPSVISMVAKTPLGQNTSLIHSDYSKMSVSPRLKTPVYSVSRQTLPMDMKSFIPSPPLYPEGLLSYPHSSSAYTDANCLVPNIPGAHPYTDRKPIVPSPPLTAPPYATQHLDTGASSPSLPSTSKCSKTLRCSPYEARDLSPAKTTQVKTDKRRKRLPKEVLTISQINESNTDLSNFDNNNITNSSIYPTTKPGIFAQTLGRRSSRCLRVSQPTDYFYRTTRSRDSPLIYAPPPFVPVRRKPNLRLHVCCPPSKRRWVRKKPSWQFCKRESEVKIPIVETTASKPIESDVEGSCRVTPKVESTTNFVETAPQFVDATPMFVESKPKFVGTTQDFVEPPQNFVTTPQKFVESTPMFVESKPKFVTNTQNFVEPPQKFVESTQNYVEQPQNFVKTPQKFIETTSIFVETTQKFVATTQNFIEPPQKFVESTQNYVEQPQNFVAPTQNFVEPPQKFVESTQNYVEPQEFVEPTQNFVEPPQKFIESTQNYVESTQKFVEPTQNFVEPPQKFIESTQNYVESTQKFVEPTQNFVEPPQKFIESTQNYVESTQKFVEPTQNFVEPPQKFIESTQNYVESTQKFVEPTQNFVEPPQKFVESTQNYVDQSQNFVEPPQNFVEPPQKFVEPTPMLVESTQKFVKPTQKFVEPTQKFVEPIPMFVESTPKFVATTSKIVEPKTKSRHVEPASKFVEPTPDVVFAVPPQKTAPAIQNLSSSSPINEHVVPKTTARKRGRPPKNSKSKNACAQDNIPSTSKHIPAQKNYPATRSATQPRIEPLKIIKDPNSKNNYCKVVTVTAKTSGFPMTVPVSYSFLAPVPTKESSHHNNAKQPTENAEVEVEFETHLPLKKRKLSMPVTQTPPTQPTTLANVPRAREKKEEISYPATPMLSIADVYMQPRAFKTPAEKKQLPPESSNTMRYEPPSDPQFNCSLSPYTPSLYGYGKCPYSVELDCNPYCPPPVLFPPESFSHTN